MQTDQPKLSKLTKLIIIIIFVHDLLLARRVRTYVPERRSCESQKQTKDLLVYTICSVQCRQRTTTHHTISLNVCDTCVNI